MNLTPTTNKSRLNQSSRRSDQPASEDPFAELLAGAAQGCRKIATSIARYFGIATTRQLKIVPIARSNAGKTAVSVAELMTVEGQCFPSGLLYRGPNLISNNDRFNRGVNLIKQARQGRMLSTMATIETETGLFAGDAQPVNVTKLDVIGQLLTETGSDSESTELDQFHQLIGHFIDGDILQVMIPVLPTEPNDAGRARFEKDLRDATSILHEALVKGRKKNRTVCIVPTKLDALFEDAKSAIESLSDQALLAMYEPLVNVIRASNSVTQAAIIPTSAFGFGTELKPAQRSPRLKKPDTSVQPFTAQFSSSDEIVARRRVRGGAPQLNRKYHGDDEAIGILKGELTPFNIDTLVIYSLLAGIRNLNDPNLATVQCQLAKDLQAVNGWILTVKA